MNDKHLFQISSKLFPKKFKNAEITNENNLRKAETCQTCHQKHPKRVSLNIIKVVLKKNKKSLLLPFDCLSSHKILEKNVINTGRPKKNFT